MPFDLDDLPDVPYEVVHRTSSQAWTGRCAGGWFAVDASTGAVDVRNANSETIGAWVVPTGALGEIGRSRITVDATRGLVIVTMAGRTAAIDRTGRIVEWPHPSWRRNGGIAVVDPITRDRTYVWIVAASEPTGSFAPQPPFGILTLVDADTGEVVDTLSLEDGHPEAYSMLVQEEHGVVLSGAYGQDGSQAWLLRVGGRGSVAAIESIALGWTGIACSVDQANGEVLFMPHDEDDIEIRSAAGERVKVFEGLSIFGDPEEAEDEPDGFGYDGSFIDDDRVAATTWLDRTLVLDRRSGQPLGWLDRDGRLAFTIIDQVGPSRVLATSIAGAAVLAIGTP